MLLGTEVGLGPGDIVLDGDPAPLRKGSTAAPTFGPYLLWLNGRPSQQLLSSCSEHSVRYARIVIFRFLNVMSVVLLRQVQEDDLQMLSTWKDTQIATALSVKLRVFEMLNI